MSENTYDITLTRDLLSTWNAAMQEADRSARTRRRYLGAVNSFLAWYAAQNHEPFTPERLTPIDLAGYRAYLQQIQAPSSVNVQLSALRAFCTWLMMHGTVSVNPAAHLKAVGRQTALAPKALTSSQVHALLREAQTTRYGARDYALVQVLVQTGVRIGECAALRLCDVELRERQGRISVRAGKGNKSRDVPLNASARQALAAYLGPLWGIMPTVNAIATAWPSNSPASLWHSQKGGALSTRAISTVIESLVAACVKRKLVPQATTTHTLRHTFSTNYLRDHPGDLVGLAALLGHSGLETTRIYVQPSMEELAQRVEQTRLNAYT